MVRFGRLVFPFFLSMGVAFGQLGNTTTDSGLKPYGSFHGGDIDTISLVNGKFDLHAPLVSWPQRGKLQFGFTIRYDSPRYSEDRDEPGTCGINQCTYWSEFDSAGVVVSPDVGYNIYQETKVINNVPNITYSVLEPDGATHVLVGSETGDATGYHWDQTNNIITDRKGVRYYLGTSSPSYFAGALPNAGAVSKVEDPNGNQITLGSNGYTDSIGRAIPNRVTTTDFSQCTGSLTTYSAQTWQVPTSQGGTATYKLCYAHFQLNFNLIPGLNHYAFTGYVTMLQSIVLPNGTACVPPQLEMEKAFVR